MSEFVELLPVKYFEVTPKPAFNTVFPTGTVMTMNPVENKKYEDWMKMKNTVHYDKPKAEYENIVKTFINSTVKEKREFLEKYDITEGSVYWHQINGKPTTYMYVDELSEKSETRSLFETLKIKSVVSPDEKPFIKPEKKKSKKVEEKKVENVEKVEKIKKKRSLTEAQKKKIAAKQDFKCANNGIASPGLENYECPFWKYRDGRFDESGYDIDHIVELAKEGSDTVENCQALCINCHRVKTSRFLVKK